MTISLIQPEINNQQITKINKQIINQFQEIIYKQQKNNTEQFNSITELVNSNIEKQTQKNTEKIQEIINKFQFAKIYKIISPSTDKIYIGSTIQTLEHIFECHKKDYDRYLNGTHNYMSSFDLIKLGNATIQLIENYNCLSKKELCARQRYYMENTQNILNKMIPGRTKKEYRTLTEVKDKEQERYKLFKQTPQYKIRLEKQKLDKQTTEYKAKQAKITKCICGCDIKQACMSAHLKSNTHRNSNILQKQIST